MATFDPKELGVSTVKSLLGLVPLGGNLISEIFFDYGSRVKQNRLNQFTELLEDFFEKNADFDLDSLKTEKFFDVFESVLRKVSQTRSKEKLLRFRDIVISQMHTPNREIDNADFYLDLIGELDEIAIQILSEHAEFESAYELIDPQRAKYIESMNSNYKRINEEREILTNQEIAVMEEENKLSQQKIDAFNKGVNDKQAFRNAEYFNISDKEFLFYKQYLSAKGLIIDISIGIGGGEPFKYPRITEMGKRFITFIRG